MMAGRRPKPTKLKVLEGTARLHPKRIRRDEPQPSTAATVPACPRFLTGPARAEWRRIAPELHALGLLTTLDRAALAGYCQAYGRMVQAEKLVAEHGLLAGVDVAPWVKITERAADLVRKFAIEFGFTPASRTKVAGQKAEQKPQWGVARG